MIEQLTCRACLAKLNRVNLKSLKHVVIKCPECGTVNEYHYDPAHYVEKAPTTKPSRPKPHSQKGRPTPPDTLELSKTHT